MEGYLALIKEQREENDKLKQEIKRLNKKYEDAVADYEEQKYIISELEKYVIKKGTENNEILKNKYKVGHYISEQFEETLGDRNDIYDCILDKLKELKEGK